MIKITNLNKYYYRNTAKEIHVVNNVSLELPDFGLITILGTSGSGKSTLLNCLGGLTSYDSGLITYDNKKYSKKEFDLFRKEHIGYIFQSYLLEDNLTVYENLQKALEIINIFDEVEQKSRIDYVLKLVGLYHFKKKKAKHLSGGQMQRVSIARALIKNSKIILADEPTGNLDSENTYEVMNILKKISRTSLVVLVTHEEDIAKFYSDRIIKIKDGKIESDEINEIGENLNLNNDRIIHLKDYKTETLSSPNSSINIYSDNSSTLKDIKLIIRNNTLYIASPINVVDLTNSKIELQDNSIKDLEKISKEELSNSNFDPSFFNNNVQKHHKPFNLKYTLSEIYDGRRLSKFFRFIFVVLGIIMAFTVISFNNLVSTDDSLIYEDDDLSVCYNNDEYLETLTPITTTSVLLDAYENNAIKELYPIAKLSLQASFKYNFIESTSITLSCYLKELPSNVKLYYGSLPNVGEIVIGKGLFNQIKDELKVDEKSLLSQLSTIVIYNCPVCGVLDDSTNYAYCSKLTLMNYFTSSDNFNLMNNHLIYKDNAPGYKIQSGTDLVDATDLIVSLSFANSYNLHLGDEIEIIRYDNYLSMQTEESYTICGMYQFNDSKISYPFITNDSSLGNTEIFTNNYYDTKIYFISYGSTYYNLWVPEEMYQITSGTKALGINECLAAKGSGYQIGDTINELKVVGLYEQNYNNLISYNDDYLSLNGAILVSDLYSYNRLYNYYYMFTSSFVSNEKTSSYLKEKGYTLMSLKDYQTSVYLSQKQAANNEKVISIIILMAIIILYSFFTSRSKLINETRTIGIRRSIGEEKKDILFEHASYSLVQSLCSSVIGYLIICLGYFYITKKYAFLFDSVNINYGIMIIGIFVLLFINVFASLLPCIFLVRKEPADIISKYDI